MIINDKYNAAIHESAHAVVAVTVGWSIGKTGVEIKERQHTAVSSPENALNRQAPIDLCGFLAELKYLKRKIEYMSQTEFASFLDDYELDLDDDEEVHDDLTALILFYKKQYPSADSNELIATFNNDHEYTIQILNDEKIWNAIINFADKLYKEGKIKQEVAQSMIEEMLYS